MSEFVLDPKGYFLIRVDQEKKEVEVAFLGYTAEQLKGKFSGNEVKETFSSDDFDKLFSWCKERISRQDHLDYMKKELKKAFFCLETKNKYVQD